MTIIAILEVIILISVISANGLNDNVYWQFAVFLAAKYHLSNRKYLKKHTLNCHQLLIFPNVIHE